MTPAYQRIDALSIVSMLEQKTARVLQQSPYLDELHEYYVDEFTLIKSKVLDL